MSKHIILLRNQIKNLGVYGEILENIIELGKFGDLPHINYFKCSYSGCNVHEISVNDNDPRIYQYNGTLINCECKKNNYVCLKHLFFSNIKHYNCEDLNRFYCSDCLKNNNYKIVLCKGCKDCEDL